MPTRTAICLAAVWLLTAAGAAGQEILTRAPAAEPDSTVPPPVTGLAPAPAAAQPESGQVWPQVLVVTDEGWHLPECSLRWLDDGSRVRVTRPDGSWRDFLPWTVISVFAADGTDLTATIAAARPERVHTTPQSGASRGFNEVGTVPPPPGTLGGGLGGGPAVRPFGFAVTVGGGYAMFAGDWYTGFEASPSLQAALRLGTGPNTWVTLAYRRQGGGSDSRTGYDYNTGMDLTVTIDVRVDEYLLMVGKRTNASQATPHVAYAEFGLAALNHVASADLSYYGSDSYSEMKLGAVVQFGGLLALDDSGLVLDLGVDLAIKPGFFDEHEPSGFIAGLHAGLGYVSW